MEVTEFLHWGHTLSAHCWDLAILHSGRYSQSRWWESDEHIEGTLKGVPKMWKATKPIDWRTETAENKRWERFWWKLIVAVGWGASLSLLRWLPKVQNEEIVQDNWNWNLQLPMALHTIPSRAGSWGKLSQSGPSIEIAEPIKPFFRNHWANQVILLKSLSHSSPAVEIWRRSSEGW